jgi:hypothetical protein
LRIKITARLPVGIFELSAKLCMAVAYHLGGDDEAPVHFLLKPRAINILSTACTLALFANMFALFQGLIGVVFAATRKDASVLELQKFRQSLRDDADIKFLEA